MINLLLSRKQASRMSRTASVFYATLLSLILLTAGLQAAPANNGAVNPLKAVSGFWYTEGREGGVELYPCGNEVCGRFQWIRDDGADTLSRDTHNPDPDLRARPLCHLQFIGGFTPDRHGHYAGGWIYNPRDGGTYSAEMTLSDPDTLDVRGYLFVPFLGENQSWKRAKFMPSCARE